MCGICGIVHTDAARPVSRPDLARMTKALEHRGPDGEGAFVQRNVGLGHRRLSIIDLSPAGTQPMPNEDEQLWITFNGEIYNYKELRPALEAKGHRFRSQTDTEVILHLYEEYGPAAVQHLNGMFAFAIWDARQRTLFAARDRFGVKPFYYAIAGGSFVFASEIKAILQSGLVNAGLDRDGLSDYLTFQFTLGRKTMFGGIERLEPGHHLRLDASGHVHVESYWDLDFSVRETRTEQSYRSELEELLHDSVRLQLRADVPVGAHLSGGLDSTTVTCLAARQMNGTFHTFSGGFADGPQFDETKYARSAATLAHTAHHEVFPTERDFVDVLPMLMYQMDEPAAGPGLFPQYMVSKLAREHVKVVLGGQGGDEIFGGYTRYLIAYLEACIKGGIDGTQEDSRYVVTFESILPNLSQLRGYEPLLRQFWQDGVFEPAARRYFRLIDRGDTMRPLLRPEVWQDLDARYDVFETYHALFEHPDCHALINKMTRFDLKTLLPALLQVEDRTSMAVSLESRVPLLDHRIVELVASMPPMVKFKGGRSKHIFREVVQPFVPADVHARTDKMGFPVPLTRWARRGPVRDFVRDLLLGERARSRGLFHLSSVEAVLDGESEYGRGLWGLVCLELWFQAFVDQPSLGQSAQVPVIE